MFNTSLEISKKLPEQYKQASYLRIKNFHKDFCKHFLFKKNLPAKTQISLVVYFEKFLVFVFTLFLTPS